MGRKADPRGKDRPRTIVLGGDVADIAQQLADKSQLSKVLTQLLRNAYNLSDEVSAMKEKLSSMVDQRKQMQQAEEELIAAITEAEQRVISDRNHILPSLYQRQGVLEQRIWILREKARRALSVENEQRILSQCEETERLLDKVLEDIKELEE